MNSVTVNNEELKNLKGELSRLATARVRVGILGNKAERLDEDWNKEKINNPTLGLIHEFGTKPMDADGNALPGLPARSFLRMPLFTKLQDQIDKIGRSIWRRIVLKRGLMVALGDLGLIARNLIDSAFETGGFGTWKPLSKFTIRKKKSSAILIDSAQLRKSVTFEVIAGGRS